MENGEWRMENAKWKTRRLCGRDGGGRAGLCRGAMTRRKGECGMRSSECGMGRRLRCGRRFERGCVEAACCNEFEGAAGPGWRGATGSTRAGDTKASGSVGVRPVPVGAGS